MIRFEVVLPLFYNDGRAIEDQKFLETDDELVAAFGATSTDTVVVRGHWLYQSTIYEDRLIRVRLDLEDTAENWQKMLDVKEVLKQRFDQIDIWIRRTGLRFCNRAFGAVSILTVIPLRQTPS
jgi:hypothetical protein